MKILVFLLILGLTISLIPYSDAHRDGCHRWHSCPSDSGSYTCGDIGYCSECPDNRYCQGGQVKISSGSSYSTPTTYYVATKVDQSAYAIGDIISIAGEISPSTSTQVQLEIQNPQGMIIWSENIQSKSNGYFSTLLIVTDDGWTDGTYKLYATAKQKTSTTYFDVMIENANIPTWIKNNAGWWSEGQIDDSSFIQGVEFLIKEKIIHVSISESSSSTGKIPQWVKNNAGWWADGQISDVDFVKGLEFLVKTGVIRVQR